jgi:phenylalanyl-tRNA synthetase beta chain
MLAPLSWLRDYAPLEADIDALAAVLSELGLVVEGIENVGEGLDGLVVARILGIRSHPNADKIRLVDVDAGAEPLQIVCGAWNFAVGDLVPLAPAGTVLPGGHEISARAMRGEMSNGMLCSAAELHLPEAAGTEDGLMILPEGIAAPGTPLTEALGIGPDVVFDLDVSPNRSDALCMAGVARDLAAALGETWAAPTEPPPPPIDSTLGTAVIQVEAGDLCPRFTGTILEGVPDGPSPAWMAWRLTLAGMRPINAVVDVSNYVMLDLGQPNHAYDLEELGGGGILVRRGRPGETLTTLDGVDRSLEGGDCVICDAEGIPVGVGGIMGGAQAEIGPSTRRVLLEAAWFSPMAIARTGKRLGLHSEARVRFERGVDPAIAPAAVERFAALLCAIEGGGGLRRGPMLDVQDPHSMPAAPIVKVRTGRVNAILGTQIPDADISRLLTPIGFAVNEDGVGVHEVAVPTWRLECSREIDVIEEVARMWGYRRIDRTLPAGSRQSAGGLTAQQKERRSVRRALAGAGFDEAWTTTFLAPGDLERAGLDPAAVEVENPLDRSESILRTALLPGLLKAVKFNVDRQAGDVCLFEIGRVFARPSGAEVTPDESEHLAAIVALTAPGGEDWSSSAAEAATRTWVWLSDALRLEAVCLAAGQLPGMHPTRGARIVGSGATAIGVVGEVDPGVVTAYGLSGRVGYLEVSLDILAIEPRRARRARDVSRYPASDLDLAFLVDDAIPATAVQATLRRAGGDLIETVTLFDVYRGAQVGAGQRSLAFRLRYRAADRTLSDAELVTARQRAIDAVGAEHGAELRT